MAILHDDLRSAAYAEPGRWDEESQLQRLDDPLVQVPDEWRGRSVGSVVTMLQVVCSDVDPSLRIGPQRDRTTIQLGDVYSMLFTNQTV